MTLHLALRTLAALFFAGVATQPPLQAFAWDRQKAFTFLEARQQEWADWKPAQSHGGACVSCHSGLSYLFARQALGEKKPRPLESSLVQGVTSRLLANPPRPTLDVAGAEAVLNLLTLSFRRHGPTDPLDAADRAALKSLWESQVQEGPAKGSWEWVTSDLDPMDSVRATYYGAALAARALSVYPAAAEPAPDRVDALRSYLKREAPKQPLHHRLAWIAFSARNEEKAKSAVLKDLWAAQSGDGGWSTAALGPWPAREKKPVDSGSNPYATAWAAFTARESGVGCSDAGLKRAIDWLAQHQDPATGAWNSVSMNKVHPKGSMPSKFMTDAATGYAAAVLIGCAQNHHPN